MDFKFSGNEVKIKTSEAMNTPVILVGRDHYYDDGTFGTK